MTLRHLQKWHGAGNDFLIEVFEQGTAPWWNPTRAKAVLDRHTGVGADGLILAAVGSEVEMTLYNADGSIAEMSGNGIRCLAAAVRKVTRGTWNSLQVKTLAGYREVQLKMQGEQGVGQVSMGPVSLLPSLEGTLGVASVGNPHAVVVDDSSLTVADREAMAINLSEQLGGANVEFIKKVDGNSISMTVYERGVGWTLACGTGSCAAAFIARSSGMVGDVVTVKNPGGDLVVDNSGKEALLSGPMEFVAHVEWLEA